MRSSASRRSAAHYLIESAPCHRHSTHVKILFRAFLLIALFGLAACDSPKSTADTLRKEIATYRATPDDQLEAKIEKDLAKLDGQISDLEAKGKTADAGELRSVRSDLVSDFNAAKLARAIDSARHAIKGFGDAIQQGVQSVEKAIKQPDDKKGDQP
jgi:hypothetical protein